MKDFADKDRAHEQAMAAAEQECHFKEHARKVVQRYLTEMYLAGYMIQPKRPQPNDPRACASSAGVVRSVGEYIRSLRG